MFESHKGDKIQTTVENLETSLMTESPASICQILLGQLNPRLEVNGQDGRLVNLVLHFSYLLAFSRDGHDFTDSYESLKGKKPVEFSQHLKNIKTCLDDYGCELHHKAL